MNLNKESSNCYVINNKLGVHTGLQLKELTGIDLEYNTTPLMFLADEYGRCYAMEEYVEDL